jgi:tRNA pseudouridine13 synthase
LNVPAIDELLGIRSYATKALGVGGVIKQSVDDFVVEEVLVDGSVAKTGASEAQVLGATSSKQPYLLCVLVKRNWDALIAIKTIAEHLGINPTRIDIAGIKDAKAVTGQHITIEHVSMENISKVNIKDLELRPVGYFHDRLSSYYLLGNNFRIKIKGIAHSKTTIEKRIVTTIKELEKIGGIPNFFGHQRFGTTRPITHLVGKAMITGSFQEAAMLFLAKPSPNEHPESRAARLELESKQNFRQALQDFPRQLRFERLMLSHLAEKPDDFVGAFRRLPIKLQVLFVQAYQSYLFNCFISHRILNGVPLNTAATGDYYVNVERSGLPMVKTGKIANGDSLAEVNRLSKAGKIRVAVPMVGAKQKLSQGTMGEIEKQILEAEGIRAENFRVEAMPDISERGGLRTAISPIHTFKLNEVSSDTDSAKQQADVGFMLLKGSYATMLLREIMKPPDPAVAGF